MSSFPNDPATAESNTPPDSASLPSSSHDVQDRPASNDHTHDDDPAKKKKGTKRRKVNHACLYCRRSHMTCDEGRPCQRWCVQRALQTASAAQRMHRNGALTRTPLCVINSIKREIGHLCHDERRSTPKEKGSASSTPAPLPNPPVDVARALPGKHLLASPLTRPFLLTLLSGCQQ